MTMIVDRLTYPPASLQDSDKREVSGGMAHVNVEKGQATFFPFERGDKDIVLKKAALLAMQDGKTYPVSGIEYTEIPQVGCAGPHYEIDLGDSDLTT